MSEHQVKSQAIRLLDVWAIGPIMILGALRLPKKDRPLAWVLGALGASTIVFNARNYERVKQIEQG